ncbi:hypothetical protein NDA16_002238 [Ustilago loliicola]|nr:hypothetical protein NDA16_002238 [Ustilago loliicola]
MTTAAPSQRDGPTQPSSHTEQPSELWTRNPRPSIPAGWQSEWQDLRDRPSDEALPQPGPAASSRAQNSRFSFSSSDPTTTSSGNQSGADSGRRGSSIYATPIDTQRFSYTASESGDSAQHRASISVFRHPIPDASRSWSYARASSSSNEGVVPQPTSSTPAASITREKRLSGTQASRERSNPSLFSAAAASSDCDPTLSRDQHTDVVASGNGTVAAAASHPALDPATIVHRAFDRYEEPAQDTIAASRRSSMLRSVYSDAAGSGHSSMGTKEVDQLRRGPEVTLHQDSIDTVFDAQPARTVRRPRALSLMDRLRGKTARAAEAPIAEANMVTMVHRRNRPEFDPSLSLSPNRNDLSGKLR